MELFLLSSVSQLILKKLEFHLAVRSKIVNATLLKMCFLSKCEGINDVFCITLRYLNFYPRS